MLGLHQCILWGQTLKLWRTFSWDILCSVSVFIIFLFCLFSAKSASLCEMSSPSVHFFFFFFWQATIIRAVELNWHFHTPTHRHIHRFELEHLNRKSLHSSLSLLSSSLIFCWFRLKRCWPLKNQQQDQSTLASNALITNSCTMCVMQRGCRLCVVMHLLIMGSTLLCSDSC